MAERKATPKAAPRKSAARKVAAKAFPGAASDEVFSAAGKHLSEAAMGLVMRALPDELVRDITARSAPLTRYGGLSRVGAAALSRGLKLLAQPPAAQRPLKDEMTLLEIAERVGRSPDVVRTWGWPQSARSTPSTTSPKPPRLSAGPCTRWPRRSSSSSGGASPSRSLRPAGANSK